MNNKDLLIFHEATENDLNKLLDIYNYYLANTTVTFDYGAITLEEFKSRISINHNRYKTFLVHMDNEVAGFCFLSQFRKKMAYDKTIELGLYLKPEFTGKGLGGKVVEYLENVAKEKQFEVIIASISGENTSSIKLFKKLKYEQCAHYKGIAMKFGRKIDIIDFQKSI